MTPFAVPLGGTQETLLIPLHGRPVHSRRDGWLMGDPKAVERVEEIDDDVAEASILYLCEPQALRLIATSLHPGR